MLSKSAGNEANKLQAVKAYSGSREEKAKLFALLKSVDSEFFPPLSDGRFERIGNAKDLEEYLDRLAEGEILYIEEKNRAIGLIGYFVKFRKYGCAFIENISVAKKSRKKGHGTTLLRECLGRLSGQGAAKTLVRTWSTNAASIALYNKFGFTLEKAIKDDRAKGVHTLHFEKKLGGQAE